MFRQSRMVIIFLLAILLVPAVVRAVDLPVAPQPALRAAIFVQNRAGEQFSDKLEYLNDLITAGLTQKGFSIIDRHLVAAKFREEGRRDRELAAAMKAIQDAAAGKEQAASIEDAIAGASALRLAQMIGADYLVVATVSSAGSESRQFKGYGIENTSTIHTVRVSLKVLEGNQGGSLYADMVTATKSYMAGPSLTIVTSDLINSLLDEAAQQISLRVADKVQTIRDMKVKSVPVVSVTIASDPQGVTVELDGAVLGSTPGTFAVPPGLHQLRLTQQWLNTWERTVNVTPNQSLSIKMELSDAGLARFKTLERFKQEMVQAIQNVELEKKEREAAIDIAKEQSEAAAYAKKKVAEGEKTKRENSYTRIERAPSAPKQAPAQSGSSSAPAAPGGTPQPQSSPGMTPIKAPATKEI